jgi:hypothetical protein
MQGCGSEQPVHCRDRIGNAEAAPESRDRKRDWENPIRVLGGEIAEPAIERICGNGIAATDAIDAAPQLADANAAVGKSIRRRRGDALLLRARCLDECGAPPPFEAVGAVLREPLGLLEHGLQVREKLLSFHHTIERIFGADHDRLVH